MARVSPTRRSARLALDVRSSSSRLAWTPPGTILSLAGVHGGSGTTTLCLLLAEAITAAGNGPALTVDLAGRSRGGLAVLAGAAAPTTAEGACALAAVHGIAPDQPFALSGRGVRVMGARPDGVEELGRSHETVVARLVEAVRDGADDARLADLARFAVREDQSWQALRWDGEQVVEAVARVLDQAALEHALVAVDLGMVDSDGLADAVGARSDLHIWVVPGRAASIEIAERRLPLSTFEAAGGEAIAVWQAGDSCPSAKRLSRLGELRGCPVVRVGHQGDPGDDSASRMHRCLTGITELCELAH
jgi:hypothetical protein